MVIVGRFLGIGVSLNGEALGNDFGEVVSGINDSPMSRLADRQMGGKLVVSHDRSRLSIVIRSGSEVITPGRFALFD